MRQFDAKEIEFIINNETTITLGKMAKMLKCNWKEVYAAYDEVTRSDAYKQRVIKRTQAIKDSWKKGKRKNDTKIQQNPKDTRNQEQYPKSLCYPSPTVYDSTSISDPLWADIKG